MSATVGGRRAKRQDVAANRLQHTNQPSREELQRRLERQQQEIKNLRDQLTRREKQLAEREKQIADAEKQNLRSGAATGAPQTELDQLLQAAFLRRAGRRPEAPWPKAQEPAQTGRLALA